MIDGNTKITDLDVDDDENQNELEHKAHEHGSIDKDFYDKLPEWFAYTLDNLDKRFYGKSWFEEAWQKYRDHVMNSEIKDIRAPGYVFNEYIKKDKDLSPEEVRYGLEGDYYVYPELRSAKERAQDLKEVCYSEEDINSLKHSGIKGMHWGVRRYQNEDGTLTEEGKARYGKQINEIIKANKGEVSKEVATNYVLKKESDRLYEEDAFKAVKASKDLTDGIQNVGKSVANVIPDKPGKTVRGQYPDLSDQELQKRVNRIQLEQRYSDLKGDTKYVKSGEEKTREAIQTITAATALAGSVIGLVIAIKGGSKPKGG